MTEDQKREYWVASERNIFGQATHRWDLCFIGVSYVQSISFTFLREYVSSKKKRRANVAKVKRVNCVYLLKGHSTNVAKK